MGEDLFPLLPLYINIQLLNAGSRSQKTRSVYFVGRTIDTNNLFGFGSGVRRVWWFGIQIKERTSQKIGEKLRARVPGSRGTDVWASGERNVVRRRRSKRPRVRTRPTRAPHFSFPTNTNIPFRRLRGLILWSVDHRVSRRSHSGLNRKLAHVY